jgi:hypothetical protein
VDATGLPFAPAEPDDVASLPWIAAPQPVLVITHCSEHGTPFDLTRAAYHLGNRHVPIELKPADGQAEKSSCSTGAASPRPPASPAIASRTWLTTSRW